MDGGLLALGIQSFAIGFSGAMMPGPLLAVTIGETARRGRWAGTWIATGHSILEAFLVVGLVAGIGSLFGHPFVIFWITLAGGLVMAWMGIGMLRSCRRLSWASAEGRPSGMHPLLAGAVVSAANPYWLIWWATVGIKLVQQGAAAGAWGVAAVYVGHILSDYTWYAGIGLSLAAGRGRMGDGIYRGLIAGCGVLMLFFAVRLVVSLGG